MDDLGGISTALKVLKEEIGSERPLELADYTYRGILPSIPLGSFSSSVIEAMQPEPWPRQLAAVPPSVRSAYLRLLHGDNGIHDYVLTMMPYTFPEVTE